MKSRLALAAAVSSTFLTLALSPYSRAQQENPSGRAAQNPTAGQTRTQTSAEAQTIRGVIAAITAEGEAVFDYRTNRAVAAEGAFLTVVASPTKENAGEANRAAAAPANERGSMNRKRHNIYHVWMTPRTKLFECTEEREKAGAQNEAARSEQKKEIAFDSLEVGDHVEIQFTPREESGSAPAHQTEQMRGKHGRHRTHVGYASEITVLPPKSMAEHENKSETREKTGSQ